MTKYVWDGVVWKPVMSGGYFVNDPTLAMKIVENAWVWDGAAWMQYYIRAVPTVLTLTVNGWDKITASWTSIAPGATYKLKRDGTVIYSGTGLTFQDTLLSPSTAYTYTVEASQGETLLYTDTESATTSAYGDLGLSATVASYAQINLAWSALSGSANEFELYRGGTLIYRGTGTAHNDGGLAAGTRYDYTLYVQRSDVNIQTDTAGATTSTRPTSSGSWNGPASTTSGGWTSCTAQHLNGPNFPMPVNGYVTSWNILVWGYGSATGHCNPNIGGHYYGLRNVGGERGYQHVDGGNLYLGAGTYGTGCNTGGNCSYSTEWDSYSGAAWNYNVSVGTINYWWYTAMSDELRAYSWWDRAFEEIEIHLETWGVGKITKAVITNKETGEILREWVSEDHDESLYV